MAERPLRVAIVVGEESGDQLGAALIDAIRRRVPDAEFVGVAGARMKSRGMTSVFPLTDVAVMGIGAIAAQLPRIVRRVYQAVDAIVACAPDALVIVDSPDFTHPVARRVRKRLPTLPIADYVSPTVWAWRPWRAKAMRAYVDHVLALLPFEPEAHRRLGGPPCTYVGHPLIEQDEALVPRQGERMALGAKPVLLVLPGSRRTEIERLMPPFGETVARITKARPEVEIVLPAVPHLAERIRLLATEWPKRPEIVVGEAEKLAAFRRAHAALAASGTVTLELGLAGVPMVVAYRVDLLVRMLKPFVSIRSIVLANLVLGENAVPEFVDEASTAEALARETLALLSDGAKRQAQVAALARMRAAMLLPEGQLPSDRAAEIVLGLAERRSASGGLVGKAGEAFLAP